MYWNIRMRNYDLFNGDSVIGHKVPSRKAVHFYSATKFAVTAIVEGIRQELREIKSNCRVTVSFTSVLYS